MNPAQSAPAHAAPANAVPVNAAPANAAPANAAPVNAVPANAAPVQSGERVQVIVMDLTPRGGVEEDAAQTLTTMMATELSAYENLQVTSGEDIRKMMDLDAVKAKAGCGDDASCVAEIAGALGAPYAVYGTVSALGPYTLLHLSLFDVAAAKNISREAVRVKESFELLDRVPRALANLTAPVREAFGAIPVDTARRIAKLTAAPAIVEDNNAVVAPADSAPDSPPPDGADVVAKPVATPVAPQVAAKPASPPTPALEETPVDDVGEPRVQVLALDLETWGMDKNSVRTLNVLVVQALSRHRRLQVISTADIRQMMDLEANKAAMGCDTNSCLAEIAGAIGAQYVVYGTVGQLEALTVVQLNLFDSAAGQSVNREKLEQVSLTQVGRHLDGAVHRLVSDVLPREDRWTPEMALDDDVGSWAPVAAWTLAGGGVLATALGMAVTFAGTLPAQAHQSKQAEIRTIGETDPLNFAEAAALQDQAAADQAQWEQFGLPLVVMGGAVVVVGVAAAIGGTTWAFIPGGSE